MTFSATLGPTFTAARPTGATVAAAVTASSLSTSISNVIAGDAALAGVTAPQANPNPDPDPNPEPEPNHRLAILRSLPRA